MGYLGFIENFNLSFQGLEMTPTYLQAGLIVFSIFVLVLTLASVRRHYMDWSFKGIWVGLFLGFFLAIFLEAIVIVGGRTIFTELLGWDKTPALLENVLTQGRSKLVNVLGVTEEIPSLNAQENPETQDVINLYQSLSPPEAKKAKLLICTP